MLTKMIQAAMKSSRPCTIVKSPPVTALTSSVPSPGSPNTVSTSTEPGQQAVEEQAGGRRNRDHRVAERVPDRDVDAAEPSGAGERDVVQVELLQHRGAGEAHREAHAVQAEHDRGQGEMVEAVEHPLARAEEREQAGPEAEQVEREQSEREHRGAHEEDADRHEQPVEEPAAAQCGEHAEGDADQDRDQDARRVQHQRHPDTRRTSLMTSSLVMIERPKSPCSTPESQSQYCTGSGSPSLYFALIASICSGEVGASSSSVAIGPPGAAWVSVKAATLTSSTSGTRIRSRRAT